MGTYYDALFVIAARFEFHKNRDVRYQRSSMESNWTKPHRAAEIYETEGLVIEVTRGISKGLFSELIIFKPGLDMESA